MYVEMIIAKLVMGSNARCGLIVGVEQIYRA